MRYLRNLLGLVLMAAAACGDGEQEGSLPAPSSSVRPSTSSSTPVSTSPSTSLVPTSAPTTTVAATGQGGSAAIFVYDSSAAAAGARQSLATFTPRDEVVQVGTAVVSYSRASPAADVRGRIDRCVQSGSRDAVSQCLVSSGFTVAASETGPLLSGARAIVVTLPA